MTPSAVRQAIAAVLREAGWHESAYGYDFISADSRHLAHKAFGVGVRSTSVPVEQRQRRPGKEGGGILVESEVAVRFLVNVKDQPVAGTDAAMDAEVDLVRAVLGSKHRNMVVSLSSIPERRLLADGTYYRGEVRFSVMHTYPLA